MWQILAVIACLCLCLLPVLSDNYDTLIFPDHSEVREVHAFYYPWYGTPQVDGKWIHWNHTILPHWRPEITNLHPKGAYSAPADIGANFRPTRGLYSSKDSAVLQEQMQEMKNAGIDVAVVSWWGQQSKDGTLDGEGVKTDSTIPAILNAAGGAGMKITLHLEPYANRQPYPDVYDDLRYIIETYGAHPAFYRHPETNKPLFYVYDAYHNKAADWRVILDHTTAHTIRNSALDSHMIATFLTHNDYTFIQDSHFDGIYTYFVNEGFTYANDPATWQHLSEWTHHRGLTFIPSVGPGYDDTRIRPWNGANKRDRNGGAYYDKYWQYALEARVNIISITSYNEWGEGTQIEPASPFTAPDGTVLSDYSPHEPDYYIQRTKHWAEQFKQS